MKHKIFILTILTLLTISCKAQTIYPLEGPYGSSNDPKPWYMKDVNNIRAPYIGVWKGTAGNKELTIYLYPLAGVPNGLYGPLGLQFQDGIMGYYIYKENGIIKIDSKNKLLSPHKPNDRQYGPIFGFTFDGKEMTSMRFMDYGINLQNQDGSTGNKRANADMVITNPGSSQLTMSFKLHNPARGIMAGDFNLNFSLPTNLVLTKISNTPPTLE